MLDTVTLRPLVLATLALAAASLFGCTHKESSDVSGDGKVTTEDCEKVGDHLIAVLTRDSDPEAVEKAKPLMNKVRAKEVSYCFSNMSPTQAKCALDAKTGAEIDACTPRKAAP